MQTMSPKRPPSIRNDGTTTPSRSVTVVTASIGHHALGRCVASIQSQTYSDIRHLVVVDGQRHAAAVEDLLAGLDTVKPIDVLVFPHQTGHSGFFGYRLYGALSMLLDEDVVAYLDEDNWFEPEHVESCVKALSITRASWVYAMRVIWSEQGEPLCEDDCDSLGFWPKFATLLDDSDLTLEETLRHRAHPNLVDMSCLAIDRNLATKVAPLWVNTHADSVVTSYLVENHAGACTGRSTVNYALGGGSGTPADWFLKGNRQIREMYRGTPLPWRMGLRRLEPGKRVHPDGVSRPQAS